MKLKSSFNHTFTVVLMSASILAGAGLSANVALAEDVKIGVVLSMTGALAPLGVDMKQGYEQAVKDAPTVKSQTVKLVVEDDQVSAAIGLSKAQKLVLQDRVKILVGGASSAVVLAGHQRAVCQAERPDAHHPIPRPFRPPVSSAVAPCSEPIRMTP